MAGSAPARQNVTGEQLPEGLLWSQTVPLALQWLDEPGAEQEELAADPRARMQMRRRWKEPRPRQLPRHTQSPRATSQDPRKALRPRSTVRSDADAELDLDFVAELECAEERRVRPDPPPGLHDCRRALHAARGQPAVHRDLLRGAGDSQIAVNAERLSRPLDPCRPEGDRRVLPGVQDLLADGLLDLRAVGVGERLDAAATLPDLERAGVDLDVHRGPGRIGGVEGDVGLPARDLDGEIVSGLRAQSGTARVGLQLGRLKVPPGVCGRN